MHVDLYCKTAAMCRINIMCPIYKSSAHILCKNSASSMYFYSEVVSCPNFLPWRFSYNNIWYFPIACHAIFRAREMVHIQRFQLSILHSSLRFLHWGGHTFRDNNFFYGQILMYMGRFFTGWTEVFTNHTRAQPLHIAWVLHNTTYFLHIAGILYDGRNIYI